MLTFWPLILTPFSIICSTLPNASDLKAFQTFLLFSIYLFFYW